MTSRVKRLPLTVAAVALVLSLSNGATADDGGEIPRADRGGDARKRSRSAAGQAAATAPIRADLAPDTQPRVEQPFTAEGFFAERRLAGGGM